jgi:hypothetical protein
MKIPGTVMNQNQILERMRPSLRIPNIVARSPCWNKQMLALPPRISSKLTDKKQGTTGHVSELSDPILELFEENSVLKGPPEATLARRAKSYSDFYDVAVSYLGRAPQVEKPRDVFENSEVRTGTSIVENQYEECEDDLLDASQEEYQYVNPMEAKDPLCC